MKKQNIEKKQVSRKIQPYMIEQINEFIQAGMIVVIPPKQHEQSAKAFRRGGRGAIWYNKHIKGNK